MGYKVRKMLAAAIPLTVMVPGTVLLAGQGSASADTSAGAAASCTPLVGTPLVGTPTTVSHGSTIVVSLSGDCANTTFTIVAKNKTLGTITTDAFGDGSATFALPCGVGPGTRTVIATDTAGDTGSATITVTPGPCASAPGRQTSSGPADS